MKKPQFFIGCDAAHGHDYGAEVKYRIMPDGKIKVLSWKILKPKKTVQKKNEIQNLSAEWSRVIGPEAVKRFKRIYQKGALPF